MSFGKKLYNLITTPSQSRTMGIVMTLILVGAVSLTVTVAQRQQTFKQQASQAVCNEIKDIDLPICAFGSGNICGRKGDRCRERSSASNIFNVYECKREF